MISRITAASLAAFGLLACSATQAADIGRYTGIAIGASQIKVDNADFDESDVGFKWFGGVMVGPNFGVELAYIYGGSLDSSSSLVRSVESNAFTIEGLGRIPLGEKFALFGKAGIGFYNAYVYPRVGYSYANSDEEFIYGVGGSLAVNPKFELRLEWEQMGFSTSAYKGDFSMLSLGFAYKF